MKNIPLELTKANLKLLLSEFVIGESNYTHQDFFNWCSDHLAYIVLNELELCEIPIDEQSYAVIEDVNAQWDMYVINAYTIEELQSIDLSTVKFPLEWFKNWLKKLEDK